MARLLQQQQQQQQQQQCVALPDFILQLAMVYINLWQQIIEATIISNSGLCQTILTGSKDLLLTVQPAARLAAAVLVAVPRGSVAWQGAVTAGDFVLNALAKEVRDIVGDPARIPLRNSNAAAAESGNREVTHHQQQQQQQQHWEQVQFDPAVLQLLLASQATLVQHLWHLSNDADAGSNQAAAAAAAVHPDHEELLTAMGVPAVSPQQQGVWQPSLTEAQASYARSTRVDLLVITRFLWRRRLLLLQGRETGGSSSSSSSSSSNVDGPNLRAEQQQQQQQQQEQQQQIPDVLLPLLPLWALLHVELLLLVDQLPFKLITLHSLHAMLQLLRGSQLHKQQRAWGPTGRALCEPVLLQLLPHMEQYSKQQHAEIQARTASSSGGSSSAVGVAADSDMADDVDTLYQALLLELMSGGMVPGCDTCHDKLVSCDLRFLAELPAAFVLAPS
jgi:hypothetical protein